YLTSAHFESSERPDTNRTTVVVHKWLSVKEKRRLEHSQKRYLSYLQIIVRIYLKHTQTILSIY
ncbi:hypothetical protein, partial [Photobacterium damselae]|uniref:hypothetical protein n=1 Tax=Photobacterium damselae TaxID=38293 RepID=UPI0040688140